MSINRSISIKVAEFSLLTEDFLKVVKEINKKLKTEFKETPLDYAWGVQHKDNIRINYIKSKEKIEFVVIYEDSKDIELYLEVIKEFINKASLNFKFFALSFGTVYRDMPHINFKYIVPEFKNDDDLKYKISLDSHNIENGDVYSTINLHFYNFEKQKQTPQKTVIENIINAFDKYQNLYNEMVGI